MKFDAPWLRSGWLRAGVLGLTATLALSGCSGGDDAAAEPEKEPTADSSVIVPGAPGEAATTMSADDVDDPGEEHNDIDRLFVEMMVPHHQQAVDMAELALTRADDPELREFAQRVGDSQQIEIAAMQNWLTDQGLPEVSADHPGTKGVDEAALPDHEMEGMLSAADFEQLAGEKGRAFDVLYIEKMIGHHEGAIGMADETLSEGIDYGVRRLAGDVAATQTSEIRRLEEILQRLEA